MTKRVDVVQAAKDRIAEIDALQAQQDAERAKLNDFLAMAEKLALGENEVASAVAELASATISGPARTTPVREIKARAAAIISAVGRPMPLGDLYQSLVRAGVKVGGKDPRSNLSAKLSGLDGFESIPGKGWIVRNEEGLAADPARPHQNGTAG